MSDTPMDEIRALRLEVDLLKYHFEGDEYRPGIRAEIEQIAADVREIKAERQARRYRARSEQGTAFLAILFSSFVVVFRQYWLIPEYSQWFGWSPSVLLVLNAVSEMIVVALVALAVMLWFWRR